MPAMVPTPTTVNFATDPLTRSQPLAWSQPGRRAGRAEVTPRLPHLPIPPMPSEVAAGAGGMPPRHRGPRPDPSSRARRSWSSRAPTPFPLGRTWQGQLWAVAPDTPRPPPDGPNSQTQCRHPTAATHGPPAHLPQARPDLPRGRQRATKVPGHGASACRDCPSRSCRARAAAS